MATERILKSILWGLAAPLWLLSILMDRFLSDALRFDLERCLELTSLLGRSIPAPFVDAVILAEDHRNALHPGVDVLAMIRSAWIWLRCGQVQGASTIEQQFVRVATNRKERTVRRKVREQMLALMLVRRAPKRRIASAYLAVAFYGSDSIGLQGLRRQFGRNLEIVSFSQALSIVAQLKYPRPRNPSKEWSSKLANRIDALHSLGRDTANNAFQVNFDPLPLLLLQKQASPQTHLNVDVSHQEEQVATSTGAVL